MACFILHNIAARLILQAPEDIDDDPPSAADDNDTTEAVPATANGREPELTVAGKNLEVPAGSELFLISTSPFTQQAFLHQKSFSGLKIHFGLRNLISLPQGLKTVP
ncbi:hypothetical protein ElyMa_006477700 [Elysia marginata]|uniref:Uncharacterized protein n=1 Tax=Elysia marginata TaxID=1093978 RepID=A0AAV4HZW7_9GAST|nr:hypothetical protein ElyMa_006477700 [Elysia marginata]